MIWHTRANEPKHTIYVDRWREALARLRGLNGEKQGLFTELLAHVDAGWKQVRRLQLAVESFAPERAQGPAARDVLAFVDGDVVDTFREMAFDAAGLVPGREGWDASADLGDMDGDASVFMRYLSVLRLAGASAEFPETMHDVTAQVWDGLEGWDAEFTRLLRAIDRTVISPSSSEDRDAMGRIRREADDGLKG